VRIATALVAAALTQTPIYAADPIVKDTFGSGGKVRTYYLYIPESAKAKAPVD
jgi:hypothetical protein